MSVDYKFPSQFRAPKGFKSYRTKGRYTLKKEGDTDSPLRVSEKKQVDWGELVYRIAVIVIAFFACAGLTLLARMYLYSL